MCEVCLGGLLVGLGLKLVSVAGCWAAGLRCWLRLELRLGGLGGSLDGQGLSHTHLGLRLGSELLAGAGGQGLASLG